MKITLLTLGTRGDVQPYVALGLGLQRAGHEVTLGSSCDFEDVVTGRGLKFAPFQMSIRRMLEDPEARGAFVSKRAALRLARRSAPLMPLLLEDAWQAAREAQALVFHPKILNGLDIAEKLGIPAFIGFYLPLTPTAAFPAPFLPVPANWGARFNRASHGIFLRLLTAPYRRLTNRWRRSHALPPRSFWSEGRQRYGQAIPKLYAFSRHIVPKPADWDDSGHITGQWFLEEARAYEPPAALSEFLRRRPSPVLVGFGSIAGVDPEDTTSRVLGALRLSGQRGLLVGGWGGLAGKAAASSSPDVYFIDTVPYRWVLPQVSAVVHHGGAGSTGEGLRAGKPTVVCPFFGDQHFWGRRVHAIGVGPEPLPQKRMTAESLAAAIGVAVTDAAMRILASDLGAKIRGEDGVGAAVGIIESSLRQPGSAPKAYASSNGVAEA